MAERTIYGGGMGGGKSHKRALQIVADMPEATRDMILAMGDGERSEPGDDTPMVQMVARNFERLGVLDFLPGPQVGQRGTIRLTALGQQVLAIVQMTRQ